MSAFLPHLDPLPLARSLRLGRARRRYRWSHTHVSPLALVARVPVRDRFTAGWLHQAARRVRVILKNRLLLEGESRAALKLERDYKLLGRILRTRAGYFTTALHHFVAEALTFRPRTEATTRAEASEEFAGLFRAIGLPPVAADLDDDRSFARLRVAGPNPLLLRRVDALDARLPLTDAHLRLTRPLDSLAAAGAEGRLFLLDYAPLAGVEPGLGVDGAPKYLPAPLAAFVADEAGGLWPVGIQCGQEPTADAPLFTPADGPAWLTAKTFVEVADANLHEAVAHLGRTHLAIEPFVVATHRQLAARHPVHKLLTPHFRGTLAINEAAWRRLIADGGAVERVLAGTIECTRGLAAAAVTTLDWRAAALPRVLDALGVRDAGRLAHPYRDDGMLLWRATGDWVRGYLGVYYPDDATVVGDPELAAWLAELRSPDDGRVGGLPAVAGFDDLVELLTTLVYTCSVQHAAVNFPQYDVMSYAPRVPFAAYAPPPRSAVGVTHRDFLAMLPPLNIAEQQMELGYLLGSVRYTTLGDYPAGHFADPRVAGHLAAFRAALADAGRTIDERNAGRVPYTTLHPAGVPQSINV